MLGRIVIAAAVLCGAAEAFACSRVAEAPISGFQILPAEGSRVPRSAAVWIRSDQAIGGEVVKDASSLRLLDERNKVIPLTATSVRVTGEQVATLYVMRPKSLLEGNVNYRVELNGAIITRFLTSDEIDTQPPELPRAKVVEVRGDSASGSGCGAPSQVVVTLEGAGEVNFLVPASVTASAMPASALAVTNGSSLVAAAVPEGTVDLRVVAFDLSGNIAMSSEKLSTYVVSQGVGCSAVGTGPLAGALALVAMLRRRRRS